MSNISSEELIRYQKALGKRIKFLRIQNEMSQLDLASLCDLEKTSISRIENGRSNITLKTALVIAKNLEVELRDLFYLRLKEIKK